MKPISNHRLSRALAGVWCMVLITGGALGQTAPARPTLDAASFRAGMANARALATAGDLSRAEQAVAGLSRARTGSSAWYLETAQRLLQTADTVVRQGTIATAPALANRALQLASRALQLAEQAEAVAKTPRSRAAAKSLAGRIQERYLANRPAALAAYQGALQHQPTSALAKEAVARLQRIEENLQARQKGGVR